MRNQPRKALSTLIEANLISRSAERISIPERQVLTFTLPFTYSRYFSPKDAALDAIKSIQRKGYNFGPEAGQLYALIGRRLDLNSYEISPDQTQIMYWFDLT